jgi:hypothetical protein
MPAIRHRRIFDSISYGGGIKSRFITFSNKPFIKIDINHCKLGKTLHFYSETRRGNHMSTSIASLRVSAQCDRCKLPLIAPEWSEVLSANETIHIWYCPICGNEFETFDTKTDQTMSDDEAIKDFFPNLLVA